MKLTTLLPITIFAQKTCNNLSAERWNCAIDDVTGVNVCSRTSCLHGVVYRKGCHCDENKCKWESISSEPCPAHMKPTVKPSNSIGRRGHKNKKSLRMCRPFDMTEGIEASRFSTGHADFNWKCNKNNFSKNTICERRCYNFGVAVKRCRCPRGRPHQPCRWMRYRANPKCFVQVKPNPVRDMINLSLNQQSKLPSSFLRDFVPGDVEYEEELTTTGSTTMSTTTYEAPKETFEQKPKEMPKTETALSQAVHKATHQINEWVHFLQELLSFDQLTVISIDSGLMKE